MAEFRLSTRPELDFDSIAAYTITTWGIEQCDRYLSALEACCRRPADDPQRGRFCDHISPGLLRYELGKHIVFYRLRDYGILVVAVLHQRMLPELHVTSDEDRDE